MEFTSTKLRRPAGEGYTTVEILGSGERVQPRNGDGRKLLFAFREPLWERRHWLMPDVASRAERPMWRDFPAPALSAAESAERAGLHKIPPRAI